MKKFFTLLFVFLAVLSASAADYEVEAANIAAFNATEDGKVVKLTLTNAQVNVNNYGTYYVKDATGATAIKGVNLTSSTKLNGYIVGTKGTEDVDYINDPSQGYEYSLTVSDASLSSFEATATNLISTVMTIPEACAQANYGRLVTLYDVAIEPVGDGNNKQLTDAQGKTMRARDVFGVYADGYTWPDKASKITGIVLYYMTGWFLIPISADAIVAAGAESVAEFDFENNNMNMPYSTGAASAAAELQNAGDLAGKEIKINDVTATFVNSPTMATKMAKIGAAKGQLQAVAGGQIRFTAAMGRAITKIVIIPLSKATNKWAVDNNIGELSADFLTWIGNASSVRFTATGSLFLTKIVVTTTDKDANTTEAVYDTYTSEVNSIAEFKALADNTLTKLNLTDAAITVRSINEQAFYVQDATGGAHFYCANLDLKVNDILNGYVYVKKSNQLRGTRIAMTEATNADNLTITHNGEVTPVDATVEQASAFTEITAEKYYDSELMNKLIKLTGVKVKGTAETEAIITDVNDATKTISISNSKTNEFPYVIKNALTDIDYANATVIGIVCHSQTTSNPKTQYNAIMPISIIDNGGAGIYNINAADVKNSIYNLQGIRLNSLQKGLNIVNGKKVVIK